MTMSFFIYIFLALIILLFFTKYWFHNKKYYRLSIPILFSLFFLCFLFNFIGKNGGTPQLSNYRNLFFQQKGVYSINNKITLREFKTSNYSEINEATKNDFITLEPLNVREGIIEKWKIKFKSSFLPLRINNVAINLSKNYYLNSNDTLRFSFYDQNKTKGLDIILRKNNDKKDLYLLRYFLQQNDSTIKIDTLSFIKIKEGILFNRLYKKSLLNYKDLNLSLANKAFKKILTLFKKEAVTESVVKKSHTKFKIIDAIKNKLIFFRETKGDTESKLCFNIDFLGSDFFVEKRNGKKIIPLNANLTSKKIDTINTSDKINYGYGLNTKFIRLSRSFKEINIENGKQALIAPVYLNNDIRYNLPESDSIKTFFITSKKGYIDRDYVFKIKSSNNEEPFFAISKFTKKLDSVKINTGKYLKTVKVGESFFIDNGKDGFILNFSAFKYSLNRVPLPTILCIIFIVTVILMEIILFKKADSITRSNINLFWLVIIFIVIMLASIKIIISYRVIAFPPQTANFKELILLSKTLHIAITSLIVIPFIYCLPFYDRIISISLKNKIKNIFNYLDAFINSYFKEKADIRKVFIILLTLIMIFLGFFVDNKGAFFGIRYNILSILFLFTIFYLISKYFEISQKKSIFYKLCFYYLIVLLIVLTNVFAGDQGFLLVYAPLFSILPLFWYFIDDSKLKVTIAGISILVFIGTLYFLPLSAKLSQPDSNALYRLNADNPEYWYEYTKESENSFNETLFKNNTYQMWQLNNYAANGGAFGKGYAKTKFIKTGVTIPVSLTDGLFSTYILSEFGYTGGYGIILMFLLLFFFIIQITLRFDRKSYHLIWFLLGIGIYLLHSTIYMALANISAFNIPFTGQNIPFFSLSSNSDSIHFLLLILIIGLISLNRKAYYTNTSEYKGEVKNSYILIKTVSIIYIIFSLSFLFSSYNNATSDDIKGNFKLPKKYIAEFNRYVKNGYLILENDSLYTTNKTKPLSIFFRNHIKDFNSRTQINKRKPEYGLIYIEDSGRIKLNKNYYNIRSPFNKTKLWKGRLFAGSSNKNIYQLNFFNKLTSFNLDNNNSQMQTIMYPDDIVNTNNIYTQSIKLINKRHKNVLEISYDSIGVYIKANRENAVWINGNKLMSGNSSKKHINKDDIIVVQTEVDKLKHYFCLDIGKGKVISRLTWINGRPKRIYKIGDKFPFAYNITQAANVAGLNKDIVLTIDENLNKELQDVIDSYASKHEPFKVHNDEIYKSKQIAFTVVDSYTGKILSMASWPNFNPNNDKLNDYLNKLKPYNQGRVLKNPNLRDHVIGSTFKPFTLAAMSLSFNPQTAFDIGKFKVYHPAKGVSNKVVNLFNKRSKRGTIDEVYTHPHQFLAGINLDILNKNNGIWDCNSTKMINKWISDKDFLTYSLNYYQLNLFSLGLIQQNELHNIKHFLFSSNTNNLTRSLIKFGDNKYYLDISKSNTLGNSDDYQGYWTEKLPASVVFKNLKSLFSINLEKDIDYNRFDSLSITWKNSLKNFLPSFSLENNSFLKNITPNPVNMNIDVLGDRRDMSVLMRGGGDNNRWNNIKAVEAFARISTGKYINVTLEQQDEKKIDLLPYPLSSKWRYKNIIADLEGSVIKGTSRNNFSRRPTNLSYKIIAKTGTLEDRTKGRESEMLTYSIGLYDNASKSFVENKMLTCYLYMEDAHKSGSTVWQRGKLNRELSKIIYKKLNSMTEKNELKSEENTPSDIINENENKYDKTNISNIIKSIDYTNPITRNYAVRTANKYIGYFNILQVCEIFDDIIHRWRYISDPSDSEYFASASETIKETKFSGDCDDFAILVAATVKAIGGKIHIALASNKEGGHAFAEVMLTKEMGTPNEVKSKIIEYYKNKNVYINKNDIHITDRKGKLWINLDWWSIPQHVGGKPYDYNWIRFVE
jgi:Penicillin binding protein transpeptidase domain